MKDSWPDLLLLATLHAHTAINYSSTETRGCCLGPGQGAGARPELWNWSGSVQSNREASKVWRAVVLGMVELMLQFEQVFAVCFAWG